METLLFFIQEYGYLFLFFATLLEGETVVALAGFVAYEGYLSLQTVIVVAFLGGMLGDQLLFYFGRFRGKQFIEARPKFKEKIKGVYRLIERYPDLLIFGSRFMYGFRLLIPTALGTSRVSSLRFFVFNLLGAIVWATIFSSLGYFLGTAVESYIGSFHRAGKHVLLGLILGAVVVQGISFINRRIERNVEKLEGKQEEKTRDNPT